VRNRRLGGRVAFLSLYLPPVAWLLLFLVAPLLLMGAFSFRPDLRGGLLDAFSPTVKQFATVFGTESYLRLLGLSAIVAFVVACTAVVLAYPIAYYLARHAGRRAAFLLLILLVPFWTSYLLRVMAWKLMLGEEGVVNSFLSYVGLISAPIDALLYNRGAVIVTLVYVWIPFAVLPILAALARVRPELLDAAADLGASPASQFRRVTLPLSLPGVAAAFFLVFIPTVGEYITPLLVGGSGGSMYGNIIQDFFTKAANWPLGSALSMIMLAATIILVLIAVRIVRVDRFLRP
jgi:spermidine/putrescine transport system permease protein